MAISNRPDRVVLAGCLFSPTLEIPAEFPTRCVPAKLSTIPPTFGRQAQLLIAETVVSNLNQHT